MAGKKSLFVRIVALALMTVTASTWLFAAEGDVYQLTASSSLRQGPGETFEALGVAPKGEKATELESKDGWKKVTLESGNIGWLYAASLDRIPSSMQAKSDVVVAFDLDTLAVDPVQAFDAEQKPVQTIDQHVSLSEAEVRQAETTKQMAADSAVVTSATKPVAIEPALQPADEAASTVEQTEIISKPVLSDGHGDLTVTDEQPVPEGPASALELSTLTHAAAGEGDQVVKTTTIRSGPGSLYDVLGWAGTGARIEELEQQGQWAKVRMLDSGRVGWIETDAMQPAAVSQIAEAQPKPEPVAFETTPVDIQPVGDVLTVFESTEDKLAPVAEAKAASSVIETPQKELAATQAAKKPLSKSEPVVTEVTPAAIASVEGAVTVFGTGGEDAAPVAETQVAENVVETPLQAEVPALQVVEPLSKSEPVVAEATPAAIESVDDTVTVFETAEDKTAAVEAAQAEADSSAKIQGEMTSTSVAESQPPVMESATQVRQPLAEVPASAPIAENSMRFLKNANLRAGPGPKFDVVAWAGGNAYANELEVRGDWVKVQMQESKRMGWVYHRSIQPVSNSAPSTVDLTSANTQTETMPVAPVPTVESDSVKPVQQSVVNAQEKQLTRTTTIRSAPGALSDMLGWAGSGALVAVLAEQGSWLKVRMLDSGRVGWIESSAVQVQSSAPQEVAVAAPVTEAIQPERIKVEAQPVAVSEVEPQVMPVQTDASESPANTSPDRNLIRFTKKANLRAGPDAKYDIVTWAGIDSYANELDSRGDWLKVQMQKSQRIGWAYKSSMQLVTAAAPSTAVAVTATAAVEEPIQVAYKSGPLYFFRQTTNLRAGPDKKFDVVAWGARNESASELERKGDWSKLRMTLSGKLGWALNKALIQAEGTSLTAASKAESVEQKNVTSGELYEVVKAATLRVKGSEQAETNGWVSKGDKVVLLQISDGWARINPQAEETYAGLNNQDIQRSDGLAPASLKIEEKNIGWIKAELLKEFKQQGPLVYGERIIGKYNVEQYHNRISHGETFNFSYAALEQAMYKVPVEELYINLDDEYLEAILEKDIYDRSEFDIEMRTRGHTLDKALLGTMKVLGSSTRVFAKKSLLINLDKEGGRWYGHRKIALRSMASDKAMMREWMAWKLMAALGMKVPEVHFVRATFNQGKYTGLFLSIEWMGAEFLAANNMDLKGEFYQPIDSTFCGDLNSSENVDYCFEKITPQDNNYDSLRAMAKLVSEARVDEFHTVLSRQFEDESVINWIAVNSLVTDGDTYNKNYWLHRDSKLNKWTVVPWDYNLTFGRTYDPFAEKPYKIWNDSFQYYYPPDVGVSNPLKDKTLRNPRLRYRLMQRIRHLMGLEANGSEDTFGWFSPTVMHARIGNLAATVGKELYKDNFITYGEDDFRKTYESLMYFVTAHDHFLNRKLFGTFKWTPVDPKAPPIFDWPLPTELTGKGVIKAGSDSTYMTDESWGLFAGHLVLNRSVASNTAVNMTIEGSQVPKYLPGGYSSMRCVQRSWVLSVAPNVSTAGDLMVEYLQENSRKTEVPVTVHEDKLELWMNDGNRWKPLKTEVNEYSNTLTARDVPIRSGSKQRFVACSPY